MSEIKRHTCIIIDDEFLARKLLAEYAKKIPMLNVLQSFDNAVDAKTFLNHTTVEILFLDINMPDLSGIDLVKLLTVPPEIILTTANDAFAIEGYQLGIIDYLLKPISFERFFASIQKAIKTIESKTVFHALHSLNENDTIENEHLFCKVNNKLVRISLSEILFIESALEYVKITTETDTFLTFIALQKMERVLHQKYFFRIHRSFIVNLKKIKWVEGNVIKVSQYELPLSKSNKQAFLKEINQQNLF